jgi:hypothetical protein
MHCLYVRHYARNLYRRLARQSSARNDYVIELQILAGLNRNRELERSSGDRTDHQPDRRCGIMTHEELLIG